MKFSIILPSFLGQYQNAASNREAKLIRAVDSALKQTFEDFEIIIVADGCERTYDIVEERYCEENKVLYWLISKQPIWSGKQRNFGIEKASGEWIVYLDNDDKLGPNHLQIINDNIDNYDWVYFNDILMNKDGETFQERQCLIRQKFQSGTSNIAHKKSLNVMWGGNQYAYDDYYLIQQLSKYPNNTKIPTPEYYTCHVPAYKLDV